MAPELVPVTGRPVWRISSASRARHVICCVTETIHGMDTSFQSISEPWADTTTHAGKMIQTVFVGIAELV